MKTIYKIVMLIAILSGMLLPTLQATELNLRTLPDSTLRRIFEKRSAIDSNIHPLRLLAQRSNESYVQQNNTGIENTAEVKLKIAAQALAAAVPTTVTNDFKVYDYAAYSTIGRMDEPNKWNDAVFSEMDNIVLTANPSQSYLLIGKEVSPSDGTVKFRVKLKFPTVKTTTTSSSLWSNLTQDNINEIEQTSLKILAKYDKIDGDNGSLALVNALLDNFNSISRGWLSEYEVITDIDFGRSAEKLGLSPEGKIISKMPTKENWYFTALIPGFSDENSPKLYSIVGFAAYEDDKLLVKKASYEWKNGQYENKNDANDKLIIEYVAGDSGPVWIYQTVDHCQYKRASIEWSATHKSAFSTTVNYIKTTFTNNASSSFWSPFRFFNASCPDQIKNSAGAELASVISLISSSDYTDFQSTFHEYLLANTSDKNELLKDKSGQNVSYSTKRVCMIVYADRYNNNTRQANQTESPREKINKEIEAYRLHSNEALFVIAYDKSANNINTKVKIVDFRISENKLMVQIGTKNETKFDASNLPSIFNLQFKAITELANLMISGLDGLKLSDKWWRDCQERSEWYGAFLEYAGIGSVLKPLLNDPEFAQLIGAPINTSTFKMQVAFICGAWNGIGEVVSSVPELVKLLTGLVSGETTDKIGKGYNSLKETIIYAADGTTPTGCGKGTVFCKLWPTISHGISSMLSQLQTPCDKANFAGQIIGPIAGVLLPIPKVPLGGAASFKAIESVINVLKWCDTYGDVFSYLGKSIKFIKQAGGKLNIEIKYGTKYQLDLIDGKHYITVDGIQVKNLDNTPKAFDSADDAIKHVTDALDALFSTVKGFSELAGTYKTAIKEAYDKATDKNAFKSLLENVGNSEKGYLDDLVELSKQSGKDLKSCIDEFGCFVAGTFVSTSSGFQVIESLSVGDSLYAYNDTYKRVEKQCITAKSVHTVSDLQKLTLSNDEVILTTPNHKFFTHGTYIDASDLAVGDTLLSVNSIGAIWIKKSIHVDSIAEVFNFTVENCHNYFVGQTAVLVHNAHTKLLGEIADSYKSLADEIKKLLPDEAAKVANYIANKSKKSDILIYLNSNPSKVKEFAVKIKNAKVYQTTKELIDDLTPDSKRSAIKQIRQALESKLVAQKYYSLYKNTFDSKYFNDFDKWYREIFQNELGANPAPFNAHHILPIGKLLDTPELQDLMLWASKNGRLADLDFNNIENGLMVQRRVNSNGIDLNGHGNHPKYDIEIRAKILEIIRTSENNASAFDEVLELIIRAKKKLETNVILGTNSVNDITDF